MYTLVPPLRLRGWSHRLQTVRWLLLLALTGLVLPAGVRGQVRIPEEPRPDETAVQRSLDTGRELETQQRWGDALAHYENALRQYPEQPALLERLTFARVNFDIGRRYQDPSYLAALRDLTERRAGDLYGEVLRKIEMHYVQEITWQEFARRGLTNLCIALGRPTFQQQNGLTASDAAIAAFCHEMQRRFSVTKVRTRDDASQVAGVVARQAFQELGLRPQAAICEFACGAMCALDEYSGFLTGAQLDEVFSQIEGNFVGLGIELKAHDDSLDVVNVLRGSPASEAGIRRGDRIVEVDGYSTESVSTDEAANLLKGREGSKVHLTVIEPGGQARQMDLIRRRVEIPSLDEPTLVDRDYGIAYIKLTSFQKTTSRDVDAALWKLHRDGMRTLILDLRGNPGGLLPAAVDLADKFIATGNIVSTRGRNRDEDFDYRAHAPGTWQLPLVVLIDGDTASASEIFAGAVHDNHVGTIIGQRSYGKGSVQGIFPLNTIKAGVRLTTSKFYSPSGQAISHHGIFPDVTVQNVKKPVTDAKGTVDRAPSQEDPVMAAALQFTRSRLTQRPPASR